jgi:N-acetylglucosaminyldiphosphoundecaprenol N-acetyl-beta-D-mannosaminyltransferase
MSRVDSRVELLGCPFHSVTEAEALDRVLDWRNHPERRTHTVVTINVAILMMMRSNDTLAEAVKKADLVVADGAPLVWVSSWFGTPLPERVAGVDLMRRLLEVGAKYNLRVFLLGTTQQRLDTLINVIDRRYPGVCVVGSRNGYFTASEYPEVARQIRNSRPDLLLVGMPAPFKEIWCEQQRTCLEVPAVLGVGGAFDVVAGFVSRAPKVIQSIGLEWLWRLVMEPRKLWKRYLVSNSQFIGLLAREVVSNSKTSRLLKKAAGYADL